METELQQILDLINSLKDGNNNTAAQVREVLTAMANYNGEGSSEGFEIASEDLVTTDTQIYHYSFKGIRKQCCNAYLLLSNKTIAVNATTGAAANNTGGLFAFPITAEEYSILRDFIPDASEDKIYLTYVVPTYGKEMARWLMVALTRSSDKAFSIVVATNIAQGETVTTAIALNFKKFTIPKAEAKVAKEFSDVSNMKFSANVDVKSNMRTNIKTETVTEGKP